MDRFCISESDVRVALNIIIRLLVSVKWFNLYNLSDSYRLVLLLIRGLLVLIMLRRMLLIMIIANVEVGLVMLVDMLQ